jgi:LysR family glycine cleavage system transcriptional activator
MWLKAAGVFGVDASRGPKFNQSSLVIEAAIAGRGVALAKATLARADLDAGRLVEPFAGMPAAKAFSYFVVHPKGRGASPAIKAFKAWLQAEAGNKPLKKQPPAPMGERERREGPLQRGLRGENQTNAAD